MLTSCQVLALRSILQEEALGIPVPFGLLSRVVFNYVCIVFAFSLFITFCLAFAHVARFSLLYWRRRTAVIVQ